MWGVIAKKGIKGAVKNQSLIAKILGFGVLAFGVRWAYKKFTKSKYTESDGQSQDDALNFASEQQADGFGGQAEIIAQQLHAVMNVYVMMENPFEAMIPVIEGLSEAEQYAVVVAFGVRESVWGTEGGDIWAWLSGADAAWWSIWGADIDDFYDVFTIGQNQNG